MSEHSLTLQVNGDTRTVRVQSRRMLSDMLREDLHLTGTKRGCETGTCGACSVLVDGRLVKSCLMLAVQADGCAVRTVEGLAQPGPDGETLHPLQQAFMQCGGLQCGYCTPGMLMAAKALLDHNPHPTRADVVNAIAGNICRCTGYEPIINAILAAASGGRARA